MKKRYEIYIGLEKEEDDQSTDGVESTSTNDDVEGSSSWTTKNNKIKFKIKQQGI